MDNNKDQGIRINKFISDYGFCSRREADRLIADGRVTINNTPANPGDRVGDNDKVRIDGEPLYFVPLENRPKKHRWGPPKGESAVTEESAPAKRSGSRGAARRHSTNTRKPSQGAQPASRGTQTKRPTSNHPTQPSKTNKRK